MSTVLQALRWTDRPFQCPQGQSPAVRPRGPSHDQSGGTRSRCTRCRRTFDDLTKTLFDHSKRSFPYWILATFVLCLSCSSRRTARELAVPSRTSSRWYGGLRNAALSDEMCMPFVKQTQQEYARGEVPEPRAERLFSLLKPLLPGSRGLSTANRPGSLGFFQLLRNVRQRNAFEHAELIVHAALGPSAVSQARQGILSHAWTTSPCYKLQ
jgi:transposase-like protein